MWEEETADSFRRKLLYWLGGLVLAAALGFAIWYRFVFHREAPPPPPVAAQPAQPPPASEPAISHPMPAGGGGEALPALNDSDPVVQDALTGAVGRPTIEALLVPQNIVRHIVVTIDNLPRKKVAVDLRPVKPTPGEALVATQGDMTTLAVANYARYQPFIKVVETTDPKTLATVYFHLYPLFQQAYEDLGYPGQYFNDRLVAVIDDLLRTPDVQGPIQLVQPKVFYQF